MSGSDKVVIIGAGIVGVSTAYHLTLRGVKPLVIERSESVAPAASGKAGGFLARGWGSGPTRALHEVSFDMHERLAMELGVSSYRKIPTLQVQGGRKGKAPASWLDGKAAGSLMDPDTAQVTPLELVSKLRQSAEAAGATFRTGAAVEGVTTTEEATEGVGGRKVTGVVLEGGEEIPCGKAVVAMGPWAVQAEEWFGVELRVPMEGIKSTSVVFDGGERVANEPYALFCGEDAHGCHLEVYPRPNGEVYICGCGGSDYVDASRLRKGGNCDRPEVIKEDPRRVDAATRSFRGMTSVGEAPPTLTQACMRPCPPDGLPIMGQVPGCEGAFVSAGHNCWGILWGPVTGLLMSELLVDGSTSTCDISAFSPERFMPRLAGRRGRKRGAAAEVGEQW